MAHGETFQEPQVLELLTRQGVPHVLKTIESFDDDEDELVIVTKFMNDGDLFDQLTKSKIVKPFAEDRCKKILKQLATGLKAMHDRNILHRDIKVNNILVSNCGDGDQQFYLGDMGSAQILPTKESKCTFRICTAGYTAPELLQAKPYGLPYDIWGLGAVLHLLLTVQLPFWDEADAKRN